MNLIWNELAMSLSFYTCILFTLLIMYNYLKDLIKIAFESTDVTKFGLYLDLLTIVV